VSRQHIPLSCAWAQKLGCEIGGKTVKGLSTDSGEAVDAASLDAHFQIQRDTALHEGSGVGAGLVLVFWHDGRKGWLWSIVTGILRWMAMKPGECPWMYYKSVLAASFDCPNFTVP
jgi:hypothetical protein